MRAGNYSGTTETTKNMVVDAAVVFLNYGIVGKERKLGATRGGASFKVTQEWKDIEVDGARGPVKGNKRIISVKPEISAELLEINTENLLMAFPGAKAEASADGKHMVITRDMTLEDSNYFENIALIGTVSGSTEDVICLIHNPIAEGDFELATKDKEEGTISLTFIGHFDPAAIEIGDNIEPWEIRYPKASNKAITMSDLIGVTAPVKGGTPVVKTADNEQYTGTIKWNGNPTTFEAATTYIATVTLTPKAGYSTTGIKANFFKVAGATIVTNDINSLVITAVFPATAV